MPDKTKILIVDDEPQTIEMLKIALERGNFEIISGSNGKECIALAKLEKPALIVLDIMMPGMNGIEACKILKKDPGLSAIPVIMLTGMASKLSSSSYSVKDGMDIEADEYIEKPVNPNELLSLVKNMLK